MTGFILQPFSCGILDKKKLFIYTMVHDNLSVEPRMTGY